MPGIVAAERDQVISIVGGQNRVPPQLPSGLLLDRNPVNYFNTTVWNSYANQPAAQIIRLAEAQYTFRWPGAASSRISTPEWTPIIRPCNPFCCRVMTSLGTRLVVPSSRILRPRATPLPECQLAIVNQSSAAILDQSSAAILDGTQYAAFGHGTMVMGRNPSRRSESAADASQNLPLGRTGFSPTFCAASITRAEPAEGERHQHELDTPTNSPEFSKALDYSNGQG